MAKTKLLDRVQIGNDNYEIFSGGLLGQKRGIIRWKDGIMQPPDWDKLETWIKDSIYTYGMNTFGLLTYSPWESKGVDDLLCPFERSGDKWTLRKINPAWLAIFKESVERIFKVTSTVKDNFILQVILYCEPWFHHGSPNPWSNNIEGYRDFYAVPESIRRNYEDAVMGVLAPYAGHVQVIIGCEMTVRPGSAIKWYNPPGILEPVAVVPEAIWMHKTAVYLMDKYPWLHPTDMGWGCDLGPTAKNEDGEYYIIDNHTSLMLEVERIVGRMPHNPWNFVHTEMHGACGLWTPTTPSYFSKVATQFHGSTNSRTTHMSTDGDNAREIGPEYASEHDRQKLYWRYDGRATRSVFGKVIKDCGKRADGNRLWCSVLPQTWDTDKKWYAENAEALAAAYKDSTGKWPSNKGKEPVKPDPEDDPVNPDPIPPRKDKWKVTLFVISLVILVVLMILFIGG